MRREHGHPTPLAHSISVVRRLCSPEYGLLGQGIRFAIAGGIVALIYVMTTIVLADLASLAFQVALAGGLGTAVLAHFCLQRFFVWVHHDEFALTVRGQLGRYVLVSGAQYASTVVVTSTLPTALHWRTTVVYVGWTAIISAFTFLIFRHGIFRATRSGDGRSK